MVLVGNKKIITVFSQKGGVGKTSLCYSLGVVLAKSYPTKTVCLFDLTTQADLTNLFFNKSLVRDDENEKDCCGTSFAEHTRSSTSVVDTTNTAVSTTVPGLFLVKANAAEMNDVHEDFSTNLETERGMSWVKRCLTILASAKFDYVIVDTTSSINKFNAALLSITDRWIVPVLDDAFAYMTLSTMPEVVSITSTMVAQRMHRFGGDTGDTGETALVDVNFKTPRISICCVIGSDHSRVHRLADFATSVSDLALRASAPARRVSVTDTGVTDTGVMDIGKPNFQLLDPEVTDLQGGGDFFSKLLSSLFDESGNFR